MCSRVKKTIHSHLSSFLLKGPGLIVSSWTLDKGMHRTQSLQGEAKATEGSWVEIWEQLSKSMEVDCLSHFW